MNNNLEKHCALSLPLVNPYRKPKYSDFCDMILKKFCHDMGLPFKDLTKDYPKWEKSDKRNEYFDLSNPFQDVEDDRFPVDREYLLKDDLFYKKREV